MGNDTHGLVALPGADSFDMDDFERTNRPGRRRDYEPPGKMLLAGLVPLVVLVVLLIGLV